MGGEARTTPSLVNARTKEAEALTPGYAHECDTGFGGCGGGLFGGGTFAAAGGYGYQDTAIGQIVAPSHLDA